MKTHKAVMKADKINVEINKRNLVGGAYFKGFDPANDTNSQSNNTTPEYSEYEDNLVWFDPPKVF